jgi:hypothetical protein
VRLRWKSAISSPRPKRCAAAFGEGAGR